MSDTARQSKALRIPEQQIHADKDSFNQSDFGVRITLYQREQIGTHTEGPSIHAGGHEELAGPCIRCAPASARTTPEWHRIETL